MPIHARPFAACALAALLVAGCLLDGPGRARPDPPREEAPPASTQMLPLDQRVAGEIDCGAGHCVSRYELRVSTHGELSIRIEPELEATGDAIRVLLEDPVENVIARAVSSEPGQAVVVGGPAQPGRYSLSIQTASGSARYVLKATLDRSGAPQETQLEGEVARIKPPPQRPGSRATVNQPPPQPASVGASYHRNPEIDFSRFRSYAFAQNPERSLQDAAPGAYVGNPFVDEEVQREIRYLLADRGYLQTSIDQAEFLVSSRTGGSSNAYYMIRGVVYNNPYSSYFGNWYGGGTYSARAEIHTEGTLVIDIIDIASTDLVWHGWTTKTTGWRDNDVVIKEAVGEILANFPGD